MRGCGCEVERAQSTPIDDDQPSTRVKESEHANMSWRPAEEFAPPVPQDASRHGM